MQLRLIGYILAGLLLLGAVLFVRQAFDWKHDKEVAEQASAQKDRNSVATSAIATDASAAQAEIADYERTVETARSNYHRAMQEAEREDTTVADFRNAAVPQRMRDLAKARRELRNRARRDEAGGGVNGEAPGGGGPGEETGGRQDRR